LPINVAHSESLGRLEALLKRLPPLPVGTACLSVGCGAFDESALLRRVFAERVCVGLDLEPNSNGGWCVQGEAAALPFAPRLGLILARHPDVWARGEGWRVALGVLPHFLAVGGGLVVTTYTAAEAAWVRSVCPFLGWLAMTDLPPSPLTGADSYGLGGWRK